jgi:uncharacterized membrane protein
MKTLAFVIGLCIIAIGVVGIFVPSELVWIAQHSGTRTALAIVAVVRVALGIVFISAAAGSRTPRTLRILGYVVLVAGFVTVLMALTGVGMESTRAIIDWWLRQGSSVFRLDGALAVAIGGFIAYTCAPASSRT